MSNASGSTRGSTEHTRSSTENTKPNRVHFLQTTIHLPYLGDTLTYPTASYRSGVVPVSGCLNYIHAQYILGHWVGDEYLFTLSREPSR